MAKLGATRKRPRRTGDGRCGHASGLGGPRARTALVLVPLCAAARPSSSPFGTHAFPSRPSRSGAPARLPTHPCHPLSFSCPLPMAAKAHQLPQDNTGTSVLSQLAPTVSPASSVLASIIPLPEHPLIVYSVYACPPTTQDPLDKLEHARRGVLLRNVGKNFVDSLFPCVHITKDAPTLYVFAIGSTARRCDAQGALLNLQPEHLSSECAYTSLHPLPLWHGA